MKTCPACKAEFSTVDYPWDYCDYCTGYTHEPLSGAVLMQIGAKCPGCLRNFIKHHKDPNDYCDDCTDESFATETQTMHMKKRCTEHRWVWSGVPRGSVWCGECDITYDENIHGKIKDLSGESKVDW